MRLLIKPPKLLKYLALTRLIKVDFDIYFTSIVYLPGNSSCPFWGRLSDPPPRLSDLQIGETKKGHFESPAI